MIVPREHRDMPVQQVLATQPGMRPSFGERGELELRFFVIYGRREKKLAQKLMVHARSETSAAKAGRERIASVLDGARGVHTNAGQPGRLILQLRATTQAAEAFRSATCEALVDLADGHLTPQQVGELETDAAQQLCTADRTIGDLREEW